jgi:hypothetical protein
MEYKHIGNPNECFICKKRYGLQTHHIFNGALKKFSEKYGFLIKVCAWCHTIDKDSIHNNANLRKKLKAFAQRIYEQTHTREDFIREVGKNYL